QAQAAYEAGGLPALLPKKPGPRRAHKLSEEIVEALREMQDQASDTNSSALAEQVRERFGVSVHPRSIERALARQEKKHRP
ncbi:MAG: helix-turn-helix domain-containing protein, partial [Gammaproteobacteria bacterium]